MKIFGKTFTIGADPEVFLGNQGFFVSAHDKLPGTKDKPFQVDDGAVQVDGMAAEFNINPAESFEEFDNNLKSVQHTLKDMIGDLDFLDTPSVFFDEDFLKQIPEFNLELGCQADYNGWTMMETPKPDAAKLMRTAGGHVHIGGFHTNDEFSPRHYETCAKLARILDEKLGVYSILWDKDDERRAMYGQAGCFRPKLYGMEYRTLSNAWIFNPNTVRFVYDAVQQALECMFEPDYDADPRVQDIINTSNRDSDWFTPEMKERFA